MSEDKKRIEAGLGARIYNVDGIWVLQLAMFLEGSIQDTLLIPSPTPEALNNISAMFKRAAVALEDNMSKASGVTGYEHVIH